MFVLWFINFHKITPNCLVQCLFEDGIKAHLKGCVCLFNAAELLSASRTLPWPTHCMFIYNQLAKISISLNAFSKQSLKKALPWGVHFTKGL